MRPLRFFATLRYFLGVLCVLGDLGVFAFLCASVSSASLRYHPPIDTDLHRLKKKPQRTQKFTENTEKICANLCNLWFSLCVLGVSAFLCASVSSASLRYHPPIDTDLHRLKKKPQRTQKFTENTEKICANLCNLWFSLCVLGVSAFLCASALPSTDWHRFTPIREKPQRTQKFTENTEKICANLCNLWFFFYANRRFAFRGGFRGCMPANSARCTRLPPGRFARACLRQRFRRRGRRLPGRGQ